MDTYIGTESDQYFMRTYLSLMRSTYPLEFVGVSLSELPNILLISEEEMILEIARCYLHDQLHLSTYRAWRRMTKVTTEKEEPPRIYRAQYGFNFRNEDGVSYSSPSQGDQVPHSINLNLLMDGLVVLCVQEALRSWISHRGALTSTVLTREILEEDPQVFPSESSRIFHKAITKKTLDFTRFWGSDEVMSVLVSAMLSGNLGQARRFFQNKTSDEHAWEKLFKQSAFAFDI
jgi:hypothetical protein